MRTLRHATGPAAFATVVVLLVGCKPSPEKVCAHLKALDDEQLASPRVAAFRAPRLGGQPNEVESCERQLRELDATDPHAYGSCAKCVMKAQGWTDGWDCWVLDHLSEKQTDAIDRLKKCETACNTSQASCNTSCNFNDACLDECVANLGKCSTGCQFE